MRTRTVAGKAEDRVVGRRDALADQPFPVMPRTRPGRTVGPVQTAHWGVWMLDLDRPDRIEPTAVLFFARGGLVLGDHAGQIVFDERKGGFHVTVSSWGDF